MTRSLLRIWRLLTKMASWSSWLLEATLRVMSEELKSGLAAKVRAGRLRLKLTQEELAARIERTPESVSNIERALQLPSIETLLDLSRILGISIAEFFEGLGHQTGISLERARLEAQLREIGRGLNDRDLRIAVLQATVFSDTK